MASDPLDGATPDVAALRFDQDSIADDIAHWCGGTRDIDIDRPCVRVPTASGHEIAHLGDWVVRLSEGRFVVMGPDEFAARMEPRPSDDPLRS